MNRYIILLDLALPNVPTEPSFSIDMETINTSIILILALSIITLSILIIKHKKEYAKNQLSTNVATTEETANTNLEEDTSEEGSENSEEISTVSKEADNTDSDDDNFEI